jgi:hypothetical protein
VFENQQIFYFFYCISSVCRNRTQIGIGNAMVQHAERLGLQRLAAIQNGGDIQDKREAGQARGTPSGLEFAGAVEKQLWRSRS